MSIKHSEASRARWAKVPASEKSKRMTAAIRARWDKEKNRDPKLRTKLAMKMVRARKKNVAA